MKSVKVPKLEHDAMMLSRFNHKVSANGILERRIVANLLAHIRKEGFKPVALHDGDDETKLTGAAKDAMELIFNLDEAWLFVRKPNHDTHYIRLIMGEGIDMVNDWSYSHSDGDGFCKCMEIFNTEDYV